jgi:hypothetical protein
VAYTKQYNYVDGQVVDASGQIVNDAGARTAINQETYIADIDSNTFDYDSIQRGEYDPVTGSHQFTSGDVFGGFSDTKINNRSYFTSETKANDQTGSTQYQDIFETGTRFEMEVGGSVFVTFGATFISTENILNTAPPYSNGSHPGRGKWASPIYLRLTNEQDNTVEYIAGTLAYTYEETGAASASTTDPGGSGTTVRRWIGWQWMLKNINFGLYQVCVVINPKVESGYCSSRQFTVETFYI